MRKEVWLLVTAMAVSSFSFAQIDTRGGGEERFYGGGERSAMMIIPFEDNMYQSDVDQSLAKGSDMTTVEIRRKFRSAIVQAVRQSMGGSWNVIDGHVYSDSGALTLDYIYSSLRYQWQLVEDLELGVQDSISEARTGEKSGSKKKNKKGNEKQYDSGIEGGQVVTRTDDRIKFMNIKFTNDTLFQFLNHQVGADYYLFISEFDVRYYMEDPGQLTMYGPDREVKVHFIYYDPKGNQLIGGVKRMVTPAEVNDVYAIIQEAFPIIADDMKSSFRKSIQ